MPRPKLTITQCKKIQVNMTPKLYSQLKRYSDRNDNGIASLSARKAIIRYLLEEEELKKLELK